MPGTVYTTSLREARRPLPPAGVQKAHAVDVEMLGRTRCVWLDRHKAADGVIVHLHSGAYVTGPFLGDWQWLSTQVDAQQCAGLVLDYRVAPDHQHPIAVDDTEAALTQLTQRGVLTGAPWVLSGHHAGAGVAVATACRIRDGEIASGKLPAPSLLVAMTPWLDLEMANTGVTETGKRDFVHERRMLQAAAHAYAGRTPLDDPLLSPVNATIAGLPPIHLTVGSKDIFLTDTRLARLQFEEAGIDVSYRETSGRLSLIGGWRSNEDSRRLLREQEAAIREALGSR